MNKPILVNYVLSPSEYASAIRQRLLRSGVGILVLVVAGVWILSPFGSYLAWKAGNPEYQFPISSLWSPAIALAVLWMLYGIVPTMAYRRLNPANRDKEQSFRFTEDRIEASSATAEAKLEWSSLVKFMETAGFFLLFASHQIFYIIPKRATSSPEELASLRDLLERKLGARRS